jgi:hypothetical protein
MEAKCISKTSEILPTTTRKNPRTELTSITEITNYIFYGAEQFTRSCKPVSHTKVSGLYIT